MSDTQKDDKQPPDGVDFSALILGFSSAALHYLGLVHVDGKEGGISNLPLARQNIDIIQLLKEKTKDNLTDDEDKLLNSVIADLQTKYIEAANPR